MSAIPQDEHKHVLRAVEDVDAAASDEPDEEAKRLLAEQEADHALLCQQAANAVKRAPDLLDRLRAQCLPRPGTQGMVMRPDAPMSFGEMAAYRMGQQSVLDLITTLAASHRERHNGR